MWAKVFKRNPYHDTEGRFTSKEKAVEPKLADYFKKFDNPDVTATDILANFTPEERGEIAVARMRAESAPTSKQLYTRNGHYTAARRALHAKIINEILSEENIKRTTPPEGTAPRFVVLGGRGGSGKSAFTNGKIKEFDASKYLVLDSDAIKDRLRPPYQGWNAHSVHEESSNIFDTVTQIAKSLRLNIVHDATLKSNSVESAVKAFKEDGYGIDGHYMFVPRQVSADRAVKRYLSKGKGQRGRLVPVDVILQNTRNEENFDNLKQHFDNWSAYDNQGAAPKLIGRKAK